MSSSKITHTGIEYPVPLLGFAAFSGTGKTTLLLKLVPLLKSAGLRIAVVKHAHHAFEMDYPGKDSYRLRAVGADEMLVAGRCRMAWIRECGEQHDREPRLEEALAILDPGNFDLVLVEGFKNAPFAKIELHRPSLGHPLMCIDDDNIVALASDQAASDYADLDLVHLPLNNPVRVAQFVLEFIGWETALDADLAC